MINKIVTALLLTLVSAPAIATATTCYGPTDQVELEGIVTQKATYIPPGDFGWVPENGFVPYDVIVLNKPVCYQDSEEYVGDSMILQLGAGDLSTEAKKEGVKVKVTGTVFAAHTAHHHQKLLVAVNTLTLIR